MPVHNVDPYMGNAEGPKLHSRLVVGHAYDGMELIIVDVGPDRRGQKLWPYY